MGIAPKSNIVEVVRDAIKDLVDQFLNDYLAVNPIQSSTPTPPRGFESTKPSAEGFLFEKSAEEFLKNK